MWDKRDSKPRSYKPTGFDCYSDKPKSKGKVAISCQRLGLITIIGA